MQDPPNHSIPDSSQFDDVVNTPLLLSNHRAGIGHGACLKILDTIVLVAPDQDHFDLHAPHVDHASTKFPGHAGSGMLAGLDLLYGIPDQEMN
jgi:hypothetical protein